MGKKVLGLLSTRLGSTALKPGQKETFPVAQQSGEGNRPFDPGLMNIGDDCMACPDRQDEDEGRDHSGGEQIKDGVFGQ